MDNKNNITYINALNDIILKNNKKIIKNNNELKKEIQEKDKLIKYLKMQLDYDINVEDTLDKIFYCNSCNKVYKKYSIEEYYYEYDDDNNKTNNRFLPGLEETFFEIQNEEWVNISSCGICNS